ncbi:aldose 1-epimerase family protein [Enterococcus sp. AD013-P3]|uniref:aldose 1-epimerase family protein n=1 Tax=Enterococcus sp. AD013-P3 TaxID=3411036 RepID=UPI003B94CEB7
MTVTIENGQLIATIAYHGAQLTSIKSKATGLEYLWTADPAYWGRHAPILFPIVGSLKDGSYRYQGKTYHLPQHGFARDRDFQLVEQSGEAVTFCLKADLQTKAVYPFDFELYVHYELGGEGVQVRYEVKNPASEELLFSIGGHPGFNVPLTEDLTFEDYYLAFSPMKSRITLPLKDGFIDAAQKTLGATNTNLKLTHEMFENDALIYESKGLTKITIASDKSPHSVSVAFNNMPYFGIWSPYPKESPFICIEPWAGIADTIDATGELADKLGIQKLGPEETFVTKYAITVK